MWGKSLLLYKAQAKVQYMVTVPASISESSRSKVASYLPNVSTSQAARTFGLLDPAIFIPGSAGPSGRPSSTAEYDRSTSNEQQGTAYRFESRVRMSEYAII